MPPRKPSAITHDLVTLDADGRDRIVRALSHVVETQRLDINTPVDGRYVAGASVLVVSAVDLDTLRWLLAAIESAKPRTLRDVSDAALAKHGMKRHTAKPATRTARR